MASKDDDDKVLAEARKRFERCVTWEAFARANALFDAKFEAGDSVNMYQWDADTRNTRNGRPCLTDNQVRVNNLLIVNDARQNKAQIKVTPTGDQATYEAAQVYSGIVRRIEYQSKATDAYSTATFHQVSTGIGYVRVVTDYVDEKSFNQEIFIKRVPDPKSIYLDPDAKDYDKADMRFAFVFNDIPRDQYEAEHGDDDMVYAPVTLDNSTDWNGKDHIREAEYWRRGEKSDTLHMLVGGRILRESQMIGPMGKLLLQQSVQDRAITTPQIEWFKIVGNKIADRKEWAGRYIPIVPFIGEETVIDRTMDRKGHTRSQIDAQRMLNFYTSAAAEQVAMQGKSPFITDARAIEGFENYWNTANVSNFAYLPYNGIDDAGAKIEAPQRSGAPEMAAAYLHGLQMAKDALMMVTGQYQANRGAPSNETSGVAIERRQRAGDNATYHFIDNQAKGIRQVGRIVMDLIPLIYDTEQAMKIMGEDDQESDIHLDPNAQAAHQHMIGDQPATPEQALSAQEDPDQADPRVIFNPNVGRYDVESDVGPAFATRRQEAFNALSEIIKASPDLVHVAGDLLFKSADFPLADELAERLKRGVPPALLGGPPQAVVQLQQQTQQMTQQAHALLGKADAEVADLKQQIAAMQVQLKDKAAETQIKDYDAETRRLAAVGSIDPASLQIIVRQMVEEMMGTSLSPMLQNHAAFEQSMVPPTGDQPDPQAAQQQQHAQMMDHAQLGLQAQQQGHDQFMDLAGHGLAVQQANQPQQQTTN